jgi:hypothetical protein
MKVYHQTGFRESWNRESYLRGFGNGLIFSPINIDSDKLLNFESRLKVNSFLDPQLYLLNEAKGTLDTYPFFPGNLKPDFSTPDLDNSHIQIAKLCVDYQVVNDFNYLIIPTRYNDSNPTSFFMQSTDFFVLPFCDYIKSKSIDKKILLSVIIKPIMLTDQDKRDEVLNWITSHQQVDGVYLIFENNFNSKQIKDFDYLFQALRFIRILKENQMEVHIGYTNTEALLYSIAMPESVSMGSYENLRSFAIRRFKDAEKTPMRAPKARLYSSQLFQWIDYEYIGAMRELISSYEGYFDDSEFRPLIFSPEYSWHFAKPEPYKHYFSVFTEQITSLPDNQLARVEHLKDHMLNAIKLFQEIQSKVLLDDNSDGSHLATWLNVMNAYQKDLGI